MILYEFLFSVSSSEVFTSAWVVFFSAQPAGTSKITAGFIIHMASLCKSHRYMHAAVMLNLGVKTQYE